MAPLFVASNKRREPERLRKPNSRTFVLQGSFRCAQGHFYAKKNTPEHQQIALLSDKPRSNPSRAGAD